MSTDKQLNEREAFEAWVRSHQLGSPRIDDVFAMFPACWEGWQARAVIEAEPRGDWLDREVVLNALHAEHLAEPEDDADLGYEAGVSACIAAVRALAPKQQPSRTPADGMNVPAQPGDSDTMRFGRVEIGPANITMQKSGVTYWLATEPLPETVRLTAWSCKREANGLARCTKWCALEAVCPATFEP